MIYKISNVFGIISVNIPLTTEPIEFEFLLKLQKGLV